MWGGDFPIRNARGKVGWFSFCECRSMMVRITYYVICILCSSGIFLLEMQEEERGGREGGVVLLL